MEIFLAEFERRKREDIFGTPYKYANNAFTYMPMSVGLTSTS